MFSGFPEGLRANIIGDGQLFIEVRRGDDWQRTTTQPCGLQLPSADAALAVVGLFAHALGLEVHHLPDAADLGEMYYLRQPSPDRRVLPA